MLSLILAATLAADNPFAGLYETAPVAAKAAADPGCACGPAPSACTCPAPCVCAAPGKCRTFADVVKAVTPEPTFSRIAKPAPEPAPAVSKNPIEPPAVSKNPIVPAPAVHRLTDAAGVTWHDADRGNLERWIASRNAELARPRAIAPAPMPMLPMQLLPSFGGGCAGGRCGR
jgi:hypothetical protein